jgi:phosphatidylglycerol:prolipoprotein diacylglycerol transferase
MHVFELAIDPVLLRLGPINLTWYGTIIGFGALLGLLFAIREGRRFGITSDFFMDLMLIGTPSALIAARAYYVAFQWDNYKDNPWEIFAIWHGGIAIYGALIGAVVSGGIYVKVKGYPFWRLADICAPSFLIGQMIGRWGNFVNQEAYGGPVSESFLRGTLHLPDFIVDQMYIGGTYYHPTFLYESLWNLAGLVLLFVLRRQSFMRAGEVFLGYLIWYSTGRFFIEGLRTDSLAFQGPEWLASLLNGLWSPMTALFEQGYLDPEYGNVRTSQLLAVLLVVACVAFLLYRRFSGAAAERYADPIVVRRPDGPDALPLQGEDAEANRKTEEAAEPAAQRFDAAPEPEETDAQDARDAAREQMEADKPTGDNGREAPDKPSGDEAREEGDAQPDGDSRAKGLQQDDDSGRSV